MGAAAKQNVNEKSFGNCIMLDEVVTLKIRRNL